jgi:hypothetical protein
MISALESSRVSPDPTKKTEVMRPLVSGWLGKIQQAIAVRKPWDSIANQCHHFFSGEMGFMWDDKFQAKYLNGKMKPRFKITLQKGFELVSIFGPTMYHQNPARAVRPRKQFEPDPQMFGGEESPMFQQVVQEQLKRDMDDDIRTQLMELYLNYTPDEQPFGGLAENSHSAITEALVSGRGVVWPRQYKMPGSQRTLTGCFFDSQENLFYDPDCTSLDDAWWVAKREVLPYWKVEREFNLPKDSLKDKATAESHNGRGEQRGDDLASFHRKQGVTNDLIVFYRIWSKMGCGGRLTGVDTSLRETLDEVCGDYCYVVVCEGCDWPLNAPSDAIERESDDQIEKRFRWPIPFWRDDKWPFAMLDFYPNPKSPYPIAPMAPGLGELTYLNIFISHLAGRTWSSSRDIIAVLERAAAEVEGPLRSAEDLAIIKISEVNKDLKQCIQWIDQPNVNTDAFQMIDRITHLFEQRTGLNELVYGLNPGGAQSRSATDSKIKNKNSQVRPDYMARRVEAWMELAADMEKFVARWFVEGKDIQDLVGPVGARLWDEKVVGVEPEVVVREMRATVTAGSMRKPNKERDTENINAVVSTLFPVLDKHADATSDTNPLNAFVEQWGDAIEMDVDELRMGPRTPAPPPPPTPEQQQMMQQQAEAEQAKAQAELQKGQLAIQKSQVDIQAAQAQAAVDQQKAQIEMQKAQVQAQTAAQSAQLELAVKQADAQTKQQDAALKQADAMAKVEETRIKTEEAGVNAQSAAMQSAADVAIAQYDVEEKKLEVDLKELDIELKKQDIKLKQKQLTLIDKKPASEGNNDDSN